VAAGYEPSMQVFVVTTLTSASSELRVALFDLDGASLGPATVIDGLQAFGAGAPLCGGGRCLVPFSKSEFGGPSYGVAELVFIRGTLNVMLVGSEVLDPIHTFGAVSLLDDGQSLLGTMGPRRFLLGDYPGLIAEGAHAKHNANGDWALGVGVWGSLELPERRLFQPRAVICGNGIVQDDEECDDANTIANDGCDACLLAEAEPEPEPEPEDPAMGTETGGFGQADANDCECRADNSEPPWFGLFSAFGVLALLRRRRGLRGSGSNAVR
jgi:cysteine-rich repeat protein